MTEAAKTEPDKKPAGPQLAVATKPGENIEVRVIQFPADQPQTIFDKFGTSITADPTRPKNQTYFRIQYLPWMRHHAIWKYRPAEAPQLIYVHETKVASWEPMPT